MIKYLIFIFIFFCVFTQNKLENLVSSFEETEAIIKVKKNQSYKFGYLSVPENRSNPSSKMIKIPIYIFKSKSKAPKKDPIIYLVGGPGSSIMNAVPYITYYSYLKDRDLILFEQRGTKYAKPHLNCPEIAKAKHQNFLSKDSEVKKKDRYKKALIMCRDRLKNQNIDLNGYNTLESAKDVEEFRKLLNIDTYNLLTVSYGTKIAQVLMREFPKPIRSVILDSPLPLQVSWDESSIKNLHEVFDKIFSDINSTSSSLNAFPNLKLRFYAFLNQINDEPLTLKVKEKDAILEKVFKLRGKDLFYLLADFNTSNISLLPYRINRILGGDYTYIKSKLSSMMNAKGKGDGLGMRLSVWCSEETPFINIDTLQNERNKYPEVAGADPILFDINTCKLWGVTAVSSKENEAIKSKIPSLIISGNYDPITPVKWGEMLNKNFENSFHIIFNGYHHTPTTYWDDPCAMEIARTFFNDPTKKPEDICNKKHTTLFKTN